MYSVVGEQLFGELLVVGGGDPVKGIKDPCSLVLRLTRDLTRDYTRD